MKKAYGAGLAVLALAAILGFGLQDAFSRGNGDFEGMPLNSAQAKELRQLHRDMEDKCFELMDLFAENSVDAGKVKALNKEIQDIRNKISTFWMNANLELKQAYPDWRPGFGGMGMGMGGPGYGGGCWGSGYGRHGWGGGPGYGRHGWGNGHRYGPNGWGGGPGYGPGRGMMDYAPINE